MIADQRITARPVPSNRTQLRIVADVLRTARDRGHAEGVGISILLRGGNLSYIRLRAMLGNLIRSNLLEEIAHERGTKYKISVKGYDFLQEYSKFEEFARSFGLTL